MTDSGLTWEELNPGDYIRGIEMKGRRVTLTIKETRKENFVDEKTNTPYTEGVVYFHETPRGWVLNRTNKILLKALWPNPADADGKKVTMAPTEEFFFGDPDKVGIRVVGSPELKSPLKVDVKLPHKKAKTHTLVPTGGANQEPTDTLPLPENEEDDMHGVCMNCGHDAILAPDVTLADLATMKCEQCSQQGTYQIAHHENDPQEV